MFSSCNWDILSVHLSDAIKKVNFQNWSLEHQNKPSKSVDVGRTTQNQHKLIANELGYNRINPTAKMK